MALIDFTLSNARRFYSSMGNPLGLKGLRGIYGPTNLIDSVTKSATTNTGSVDLHEQR